MYQESLKTPWRLEVGQRDILLKFCWTTARLLIILIFGKWTNGLILCKRLLWSYGAVFCAFTIYMHKVAAQEFLLIDVLVVLLRGNLKCFFADWRVWGWACRPICCLKLLHLFVSDNLNFDSYWIYSLVSILNFLVAWLYSDIVTMSRI